MFNTLKMINYWAQVFRNQYRPEVAFQTSAPTISKICLRHAFWNHWRLCFIIRKTHSIKNCGFLMQGNHKDIKYCYNYGKLNWESILLSCIWFHSSQLLQDFGLDSLRYRSNLGDLGTSQGTYIYAFIFFYRKGQIFLS